MKLVCYFRSLVLLVAAFHFDLVLGQKTESVNISRSVQFEFGVMPFDYSVPTTMEQLQSLSPKEEKLHRDFSKYQGAGVYNIGEMPQDWYAAVTYFQRFTSKPRLQWSAGLLYHQVFLGGRSFGYDTIVARDTFYNNQGIRILSSSDLTEYVSFLAGAHELMIPATIYWKAKNPKYIWAEIGLRFAPGLIFAPTLRYSQHFTISTNYETPGSSKQGYPNWIQDSAMYEYQRTPLNSLGLSLNAGLPITIYLRFFKTQPTLSRIHLFANVTPFWRYSSFTGLTTQSYFQRSFSTGFRVSL